MVNPTYLTIALVYPALFFVLLFVAGSNAASPAFSLGALFAPYSGSTALASILLAVISVFDVLLYLFYLLPKLSSIPNTQMMTVVFPENIAIFGFVLGILNLNPWAAVPYFFISIALYLYALSRVISGS